MDRAESFHHNPATEDSLLEGRHGGRADKRPGVGEMEGHFV